MVGFMLDLQPASKSSVDSTFLKVNNISMTDRQTDRQTDSATTQ